MPPGAERPLRLRVVRTRYPHWGLRSGYARFADHLDRGRIRVSADSVPDGAQGLPRWLGPLRGSLARGLRRPATPWWKPADLAAELRAAAACLTGRADVVHFLDGEHAPVLLPRLARGGLLGGARIAATYHQPAGLLADLVDPAAAAALDAVILMSPAQLPFFAPHVPPERLHVLLHGVDVEFFRPRSGPRAAGPFRCVTVGRWLRDWRTFRAVAERMPQARFDVVAPRTPGAGDPPNVRRLSGLSDDALAALYREADALFMPLLATTANNALLEGLASGLPIVVTDHVSTRAYLTGEEALFAPPGDAEGLAAALTRLMADPALAARMGRAARARAEALSWPSVAARHEALYRSLAAQPRSE